MDLHHLLLAGLPAHSGPPRLPDMANKIMMMMVLLSMSAIMVSGDRQRLDGDAAALSLLSKGTTPSSDRQTELRLFLFVAL
jgi:hypothetical protein